MLSVDRKQVMAFRIHAQGLHRTQSDLRKLGVLDLGVQDTQSNTARVAIAARLDADPAVLAPESFSGTLRAADVTLAWSHRGAPHLHRPADLVAMATAMVPLDDADAASRLSWQRKDVAGAGMSTSEAITTAAHALHDVVDEVMTKGAASERVSRVLPDGLLRWCRGCQATHIHEQLMRLATLRAGIGLEPDVSPATLRPRVVKPVDDPDPAAQADVITHYLSVHGPATAAEAAGFMTTTRRTAKSVWPDGLSEVDFDGKIAYVPTDSLDALANPPEPALVRLLPCWDPLLQSRDRTTLVPEKAHQKEIWKIIGNPGAVLADGEIAGTWRAKAKGRKRLELTITPLWAIDAPTRQQIEVEAHRVATARGFADAAVRYA